MVSVGQKIRRLRKEKQWTQEQLAEKVNVSPQVVSNWERNYTRLNHEDIQRLSNVFGVEPNEIFEEYQLNVNGHGSELTDVIDFIENEAKKLDLSASDPIFKKMLSDAFEMLRIARGKNKE